MGIKNIAIVDDDLDTRLILEKYLLEQPGYNVVSYSSGAELFDGLGVKKTDLILLDIEMPEVSGIDIFDKLKNSDYSNIPVIFLTGKEDRNTITKCIDKGADGYMVKPVSKDSLVDKIKEVLLKYNNLNGNSTILVIDDDVDFLKHIKNKLSKYHKILIVNSGKTALDYLVSHKVDLIVLDYCMPFYDGNNILNILKGRESTKDIPVIMVTALQYGEVMAGCAKCPPEEVITKPVDMDNLLSTIQKLVGE